MSSRIDRIRALVATNPGDPFGRYSLAMEERKISAEAALLSFAQLRRDHPDYLPAYYQHGKLLADQGRAEDAKEVLGAGIALAQRVRDGHALGELTALLEEVSG